MPIEIPATPEIFYDSPEQFGAPEGSTLLSAYAYGDLFNVGGDEQVQTIAFDVLSFGLFDQNTIYTLMGRVKGLLEENGTQLLAFGVWQAPNQEVEIPEQVCIPNPFGGDDICFTPPFAGQTILSVPMYHLWMVLRPWSGALIGRGQGAPAVRGMGLVAAIFALIALVIGLISVVAIPKVWSGQLSFKDLVNSFRDILRAPGENLVAPVQSTAWPMVAFGLVLVAGAFFTMKTGVTVPTPNLSGDVNVRTPGGSVRVSGGTR